MILYPALDLKNGKCVRLRQGKFDKQTIFNVDPLVQAKSFMNEGCKWLHIIDLDGALSQSLVNQKIIKKLIKNIPIPIQLGGGIRNMKTIEIMISLGVKRVILGTIAIKNPQLVKDACKNFPDKIGIGVDAKNNTVMVEGWLKKSNTTVFDLAKSFEDIGVTAIIYTDISKDGMMRGPDFEGTAKLLQCVSVPIIASGGVSSIADLVKLKNNCPKLNGIVCGRALYDKKIKVDEAIRVLS
tara:strand:+ start:123 stop:842 length:720 start_codon:yes stop_codon:yes gene_type:complete